MMDPSAVPAGNHYDKFNTRNPIARIMMEGYKRSLGEMVGPLDPGSLLEVGCGEGFLLELLGQRAAAAVHGSDLSASVVSEASDRCPWAQFTVGDVLHLPYAADSFDVVLACEVLEHVTSPDVVLGELARVARRYCLVSVPSEPLWRVLNVLRGAYLKDLGNTPGHLQHWSGRSFLRLLERHFEVVEVRRPVPWTMVLCAVPEPAGSAQSTRSRVRTDS